MKLVNSKLRYSATDLIEFLHCRALTAFRKAVALGQAEKPEAWNPLLEVLEELGEKHEENYVEHLEKSGGHVREIPGIRVDEKAVAATLDAMHEGVDVIVQAALAQGRWVGRADVLSKVEGSSELGDWHYKPIDAKLARKTKAGSVLQLCMYSDLLEAMQGVAPNAMEIVQPGLGFQPEIYRYKDFSAYFRFVKRAFEEYVEGQTDALYPEPRLHCSICLWKNSCEQRRRDDDHLCLVAGLSKTQAAELNEHGVTTLAELAALPSKLPFKPRRSSMQAVKKAREQARLQLEAREKGGLVYERLPIEKKFGLSILPEPDDSDIFLDFKGDLYVEEYGLQYLTGYICRNQGGAWQHCIHWATTRAQERTAFEDFVDFVMERWNDNPGLHIYHYGQFEPNALKRMMGRFRSKEYEIDRMLRAGLFVDLRSVVRNAIRAGVESYALRELELLFGYEREIPIDDANLAFARLRVDLGSESTDQIDDELKDEVSICNKDDCLAKLHLRDWLETIRSEAIEAGENIPRPEPGNAETSEKLSSWINRVESLAARLTADLPENPKKRNRRAQASWLLADILDFRRREEKAEWWEYFRLADSSLEDLFEERSGLSDLSFVSEEGGSFYEPIHRYTFPHQESNIKAGNYLWCYGGDELGPVIEISWGEKNYIDIKKQAGDHKFHPQAVFQSKVIPAISIQNSLMDLGNYVADNGVVGNGGYRAARDLLLRSGPRGIDPPFVRQDETALAAAKRIVVTMRSGVLAIQGPPGSGKTYAGSRMICELVRQGKTVGISANSHKVIRNMLDEVCKAAWEESTDLLCQQKVPELEENQKRLSFTRDNRVLAYGLRHGTVQVGGATAWFWSRPEAKNLLDVLFVDEAAQMTLADTLAISQAANTLVLLGDPQQLGQPIQGSHPDGADVSALAHFLDGEDTISDRKGLFLEETWRLHPKICDFTSELFYTKKLKARKHNERQSIKNQSEINGAGLWYLPVEHSGNVNSSPEEAVAIKKLIEEILAGSPRWRTRLNNTMPITEDDIMVITPYNLQVLEIQKHLPDIRVGTVDKFQGQEAPVSIYSTAASTKDDAPRGMEFLYDLNRFNVATSRARCACILVASPALQGVDCRTPKQMRLANAFCRYIEIATSL